MSLLGLVGSVSCGSNSLAPFFPNWTWAALDWEVRGKAVVLETVWVTGGCWCGDGALFSQAFFFCLCALSNVVDLWNILEVKPAPAS